MEKRRLNAGSAGVSPAISAKRELSDAPVGTFADGASALPAIADLLDYPGSDWPGKMSVCADAANDFCRVVEKVSLSDLQELYTRTFDLNPVCALEVGYHLFGENYKRGEFLANLRVMDGRLSGKLWVLFPQSLVRNSSQLKWLLQFVDAAPMLDLEFRIAGSPESPRLEWLSGAFKQKVESRLAPWMKFKLTREIEKHLGTNKAYAAEQS